LGEKRNGFGEGDWLGKGDGFLGREGRGGQDRGGE